MTDQNKYVQPGEALPPAAVEAASGIGSHPMQGLNERQRRWRWRVAWVAMLERAEKRVSDAFRVPPNAG